MLKGLYLSAAAALNHSERYDVVANNLANVETPGFKPQRPQFSEVFFRTQASEGPAGYIAGAAGSAFLGAPSVFQPGPIEHTERGYDLAITGEGLFAVERAGKILFTRAGNFRLGADGYVTTADGKGRLLLENGIPILVGNAEFEVDAGGLVTLALANGQRQQMGSLWVLKPRGDDYDLFERFGDGLFAAPMSKMDRVRDIRVEQGALEKSASSAVNEMVNLINAMRAYEASLQFVRVMDTALGQAVELARPLNA